MKYHAESQQGFTLIEVMVFLIILSILGSAILLTFVAGLQKTPAIRQNMIALVTVQQCMEWFIGQRYLNNYSSITCPSTSVPAFCSAPSGYNMAVDVSCTTINSDSNYKTIAVTVSGLGDATSRLLIADY